MATFLKIPDVSLPLMLANLTASGFNGRTSNLDVRLYTSNITPSSTDDFTTYSGNEASFPGYSPGAVNAGSWSTPTVTASVAKTSTGNLTFTLTSTLGTAVIVYGYFINNNGFSGSDALVYAQRFDSPLVFINSGDTYSFPLEFEFQNSH